MRTIMKRARCMYAIHHGKQRVPGNARICCHWQFQALGEINCTLRISNNRILLTLLMPLREEAEGKLTRIA